MVAPHLTSAQVHSPQLPDSPLAPRHAKDRGESHRPEFDPPPDITDELIDAICKPHATLRDLAREFNTTTEQLARWMRRDDIRERLDDIEAAAARRARLVAANYLPTIVNTLITQLETFHEEDKHTLLRPGDVKGADILRRNREAARKAASLLTRLARFTPYHAGPSEASHHAPGRRASNSNITQHTRCTHDPTAQRDGSVTRDRRCTAVAPPANDKARARNPGPCEIDPDGGPPTAVGTMAAEHRAVPPASVSTAPPTIRGSDSFSHSSR